jgi:hypothetical protein
MAEEYERGRLLSRPARALAEGASVGLHAPGTKAGPADGYLYVPAGYRKEAPSPLALLLHGAGEDAHPAKINPVAPTGPISGKAVGPSGRRFRLPRYPCGKGRMRR